MQLLSDSEMQRSPSIKYSLARAMLGPLKEAEM